jgi:hypothetical protein
VSAAWAARRPQLDVERTVALGLTVAVIVVAGCNLPRYQQLVGPDTFQAGIPVARDLSEQVAAYRTDEPVWLDISQLAYLEPFSAVVMAALQRGGVDFRVPEPGLVRQLGDNRRLLGDETLRVEVREGREAIDTPAGMQRIAYTSPLRDDEAAELVAGEQAMVQAVAVEGIVLSPAGEQAAATNRFGLTRQQIEAAALDAERFVYGGLAAEMVAAGALDLTPDTAELFNRTSALRRRVDVTTVAVDVGPI